MVVGRVAVVTPIALVSGVTAGLEVGIASVGDTVVDIGDTSIDDGGAPMLEGSVGNDVVVTIMTDDVGITVVLEEPADVATIVTELPWMSGVSSQ